MILCLSVFSFSLPSLATTVLDIPNSRQETIQNIPDPRKIMGRWVTDMADLFPFYEEDNLNQLLFSFNNLTGQEVVVVTRSGHRLLKDRKQFATELFNYWQVGK